MTDKLDLPRRYRDQLEALLREHVADAEVWAYGSRVTGKSHDGSDLDLVLRSPTLEPLNDGYLDLIEALEQSSIPILVQAHDWARLPESFHREIEKDYMVLRQGTKQTTAGEWYEYELSALCDITRGASPRPIHEWISDEGIPWLKIADASATSSRFINHTKERIRLDGMAKSVPVFPGDLILSNSATPGIPKFVDIEACIHDGWLLLRNLRYLDKLFCYYLLLLERPRLVEQGSGTVFTNLKTDILKRHRVKVPSLPEQRAIAHILGTLDDKIELNRQMNQTLEEMARAIFQDWFVDFGPVRAKLEGREPYLPLELWDLFPDRLVDSELGGIPEGWGVKVLRDLCAKPQYGYTASAQDGSVGPKFLRITDINKQAWISWETVPHCAITDEDFRKYRLHVGDILIARMADPGHGCLIEDAQSAVFASYLIRFRPALESYARFLQYWLRSDGYWDLVRERGAGTTRTSLNAQVLGEFPLLIPSNAVMEAFKEKVDCLRTRVVANVEEIRFLVAQRDALLPKLVAGEVKTVYALALEVQPDKGLLGK